jgi:hypothetical protein
MAATIYTYQSPNFTLFTGSTGLTTSSFISASVTYSSPLSANLDDFTTDPSRTPDLPTSWLFSDGVEQWTPANSDFLVAQVNTNASGDITGWDFDLYSLPGLSNPAIYTISGHSSNGNDEVVLSGSAFASAPGSETPWAPTPSPVPEPSNFLLLGSGLSGLAGLIRRKLRA